MAATNADRIVFETERDDNVGDASAAEFDVMRVELEWILQNEVPEVFMQLGRALKHCLTRLSRSPTIAPPQGRGNPAKKDNWRVRFSPSDIQHRTKIPISSNSSIRGYLKMDGTSVTIAELQFGLPTGYISPPRSTSTQSKAASSNAATASRRTSQDSNISAPIPMPGQRTSSGATFKPDGSAVFNTSLAAGHPYEVEQARSLRNCLSVSLRELEESIQQQQQQQQAPPLAHTQRIVSRLLSHLQQAKEALTRANPLAPELCVRQMTHFQPNPPNLVSINFHLEHSKLAVAIYGFEIITSPTAEQIRQSNAIVMSRSRHDLTGYTFEYDRRWYRLALDLRGQCEVESLTSTAEDLHAMQETLQRLQDKLSVFKYLQ